MGQAGAEETQAEGMWGACQDAGLGSVLHGFPLLFILVHSTSQVCGRGRYVQLKNTRFTDGRGETTVR